MFSSHIKAPQEDVSIAQVAVGPPLSRLVSKLLGDGQALQTDPNPEVITWLCNPRTTVRGASPPKGLA